jgi:ATPase subunit of ABC transporter with duplicated ATPase domains
MEDYDNDSIINVIGKYGCNKTTLCTLIEHNVKEKIHLNIKFHFEIFFETQLQSKRNELVIEDPGFLEYKDSPIIYLTVYNFLKI